MEVDKSNKDEPPKQRRFVFVTKSGVLKPFTPIVKISSFVQQTFIQTTEVEKKHKVMTIIRSEAEALGENFNKVLVICNTSQLGNSIVKVLDHARCVTASSKSSRQKQAIEDFKRGLTKVLVSTHRFVKEEDIRNVSHIIFFHIPSKVSDYLEFISRIDNSQKNGKATCMITVEDKNVIPHFKQFLQQTGQKVPDFFDTIIQAQK